MQLGKTSHLVLGHAPLRVPIFVHMVHGLHGLPTSIPRQYSGCHCPLGVCKPCSGLGWVAITFPGIMVEGKVFPGCIGYAHCVLVKTRVMNSMLCLSAQGCRIFVTDIKACLESMQLPCFEFIWQDDIRGVAMFIKECLGVYYGIDPHGGQASDQT